MLHSKFHISFAEFCGILEYTYKFLRKIHSFLVKKLSMRRFCTIFTKCICWGCLHEDGGYRGDGGDGDDGGDGVGETFFIILQRSENSWLRIISLISDTISIQICSSLSLIPFPVPTYPTTTFPLFINGVHMCKQTEYIHSPNRP